MLYMIFGGSGSGKSAYAEDLAVKLCPEEKVYLATLTDIDEEMEQRIRDHRKMREGPGDPGPAWGAACAPGVHDQSAGQRAVRP